jgi:DNA-binding MarR family transcriptional regulator
MDRDAVAGVRRFNRMVTRRIGVLDEEYLARGRPVGASRVLWEVGDDGADARGLRVRLGLDSGYLSRLLRSLQAEGLVTVDPDEADRRVRTVRLTAAGRAERAGLDEDSDALAWSLLAPLDEGRRARLVEAMGTVERLLTAGLVEVAVEDPTSADARACLGAYFAEIDERFDGGFDLDEALPFDLDDMVEPEGLLLLARLGTEPIGCGALHFFGPVADIKRMWVSPGARGLGLGRRLLAELEARARAHGVRDLRLETNRSLVEAIALYHATGFTEVEAFNDEPYGDHWFHKHLP